MIATEALARIKLLYDIEAPAACMTDALTKLVNRWPTSRIEKLMPWP